MRLCLFRYGLVVAYGFLTTEMVLADDAFSANRKMQGATRYSAGHSPNQAGQSVEPTIAPFSPSKLRPDLLQASEDSKEKPTDRANNNVQQIFPVAATAELPSVVVPTSNAAAPASPGGLKSLQQRFSVIRKLSGAKAPANTEAPPANRIEMPLVESPTAPSSGSQTPTPAMAPSSAGPVPPTMPDIRTAQRFQTPVTTGGAQNQSVPSASTSSTTLAPAERTREPATVGGPITSSRRMPTGQAAGLPREDQGDLPSGEIDLPAQPTRTASRNPVGIAAQPNKATGSGAIEAGTSGSRGKNVLFSRQSPVLGVETVGPRSITIGKEATYTVNLMNTGDAAAQDLKVAIRIPAWTEVVGATASSGAAQPASINSNEPLTWTVPRLEPNAKEQLSLRLVPRESRPFDLAVQWTFSPVASQAMVEVKEPKLAMAVAGADEILFGETKIYKLSISNPGTGDAENVVLFLAPVDGASGSPTRHEIGNIAAGQNKLIEVELTARQAGTLAIKGTATADGNLRADAAQEILVRRAGLKVAAQGPELKFAGTPATFDITVKNPGNAAAESVQVAAVLPTGAKYVSSNGGQFLADQHKVVWTVPSLRNGGEQDFQVKCILNSPGSNRLQVVAVAESDLTDTTTMSTNVEALADLKLDVSDPTGPVAVGDDVTYEVRIRNRGTKAAENVNVAGFFSGGIEPLSAQGSEHQLAPGQVSFKPIPSIAPGAEVSLKITARAEQAGNHVFRAEVLCPAIGIKLAAEEGTLFYGDSRAKSARVATKPSDIPMPAQKPTESGATTLVR